MSADNRDATEEEFPDEEWSWHAVYADAQDVCGTVMADSPSVALDLAAADMLRQVGADPIGYGKLVKVTVDNGDGLVMTVAPDYDEDG